MLKMIGLCLVTGWAISAFPASQMSARDVDAVLTKYRQAEAFRSKVKKTVTQEVIGTETSGDGVFYFSKGKLRLEMSEPENTTLVYDGKTIWMETRLDKDTVEVTKVKSRDLKKNDTLLAALFERKNILQSFKLISARVDGELNVYSFEPRDKKKTEVRLLDIVLNGKELSQVAYRDDRENKVTFVFTDLVREPVAAAKFKYKPPKGANVTEI